jgi:hypothetical protein
MHHEKSEYFSRKLLDWPQQYAQKEKNQSILLLSSMAV